VFDLSKLFLSNMIKNKEGHIINIASSAAYHPIPTMAVYAATKAFVLMYSEALSMEARDHNVKVFAMSPGSTNTNFFNNGGVSYGKMRTPNDVVEASIRAINANQISKIHGFNNYITSTLLPRLTTRKFIANFVYNTMKKQSK
ncbi:MAG: SDR family NAD(P)-dependent oxidoreductase, partial [Bacilli bacterium]